ncbi:hypothetical protein APHAL10511_000925 [Amanita phalloides]|nr:hypothetical protein APHAL10511_000925 [Amanita phalloides]
MAILAQDLAHGRQSYCACGNTSVAADVQLCDHCQSPKEFVVRMLLSSSWPRRFDMTIGRKTQRYHHTRTLWVTLAIFDVRLGSHLINQYWMTPRMVDSVWHVAMVLVHAPNLVLDMTGGRMFSYIQVQSTGNVVRCDLVKCFICVWRGFDELL